MPLFSSYIDVPDFQYNGLPASDLTTLYGVNTMLAVGCSVGALSLTLTTPTGSLPTGVSTFSCWILDGPNSERVDGATISGATVTLPSPGTLAAHGAGVSISSMGSQGCLASVIANASAFVETICQQGPAGGDRSLWQQSRTERLSGPNVYRASIDPDQQLNLRPYHFPVASVASATIQMGAVSASSVDLTSLILPDGARIVQIPAAQVLGAPPTLPWLGTVFPRNLGFVVTLTYTGGPIPDVTLAAVPPPIKEATYLLVMDRLGFRRNPTGAAMVRLGDSTIEARLRGDTSGKSILQMRAEEFLRPFMPDV